MTAHRSGLGGNKLFLAAMYLDGWNRGTTGSRAVVLRGTQNALAPNSSPNSAPGQSLGTRLYSEFRSI